MHFTLSENPKEVAVPLPPIKRIALNEDDASQLTKMYHTLLPNCEIIVFKDSVTVSQELKSAVVFTDVLTTVVL